MTGSASGIALATARHLAAQRIPNDAVEFAHELNVIDRPVHTGTTGVERREKAEVILSM